MDDEASSITASNLFRQRLISVMLQVIKKRLETLLEFEEESSQSEKPQATSFAAAALLIEVAQADSTVDEDEIRQIEQSLINYFGIAADDIENTLHAARKELQESTCLFELTKIINRNWDEAAKIRLVESMWSVVLSDQMIDDNEQHLMRKIKALLHIPQSEFIAAKFRARKSLEP